MTRCDACQLVSRTDEGRPGVEAESYALDDDSERAIRSCWLAGAARRKVLASSTAAAPTRRLRADPRLDVTVRSGEAALAPCPAEFDAAFVNGAVEHVDPVALLKVRAALKSRGRPRGRRGRRHGHSG